MRKPLNFETPQHQLHGAPQAAVTAEVRSLTGLRGIAAVWVVLYHMTMRDPAGGILDAIIRRGYLAVDLFFVLSGFVMAMSYRRIFAQTFTVKVFAVFILRRLARIYPLYIFVLLLLFSRLLGVAVSAHSPMRELLENFFLNTLLIQAWVGSPSILGASWSVSTEFAAYFLFPLLLMIVTARSRAPMILATTLAGASVLAVAYHPAVGAQGDRNGLLDVTSGTPLWPLLRCIAEFTLGLASYRMAVERPLSGSSQEPAITLRTHLDVAIGAALICITVIPASDILFAALLPPLMIALSSQRGRLAAILSSRPAHTLGLWSYAIYLWHGALLFIMWHVEALLQARVGFNVARAAGTIACWAVILPISALSYRFIETPGRRLVRDFEKRLFPSEDTAVLESEASGRARL
ncbi:acyltransferase [Acetobacter sacchari]|uniref:Acyltransferase n=1 Tax=Acetobacter sacchari TaxID=2661687 RepID=A0ABS3LW68_9PROT|nr:acyltransferase [Acetobacter sacchari]MBO1360147.1 acyltransferase [Acetobacter sacchari]